MSEKIGDSIGFWTPENINKYEDAINQTLSFVRTIEEKIYKESGNHIVRHMEYRLKSSDSIAEKIKRKGRSVNIANADKAINDLAGVRVICFDSRQVYMLADEVRKGKQLNVIKEKDYILHPKENGYQSYHMILDVFGIRVELQIRTILMDAWSSLETVLVYKKKDIPPKEIIEKIRKFSKWSKKMDHMVEEMLEMKG